MSGYIGSKRSSSLVSATEITLDGAKLKSSGDSITKSDGTTAVLSESSGTVTFTTNAAVIEGSSSGNLVRITQTGTGNALVVEDSTNPDSTPFVVDASGNVGVGVSGVNAPLDVDKAPLFNNCVANFGEFIALADYQRGVVNINGRVNGTDNDASLTFVRRNAGNSNWLNGLIALDSAGSIYFSTGGVANSASTERMRIDSSGNLKFNSGYGSVATAYGCRAWVNFNGTGTVAIRDSGNVSSITDLGTGDYRVNLATAMPDANYAAPVNIHSQGYGMGVVLSGTDRTTSFVRIVTLANNGAAFDAVTVDLAIFR